jgi:hypothetical protein
METTRGIGIVTVKPGRSSGTEVVLISTGFLGIVRQLALQVTATLAIACPFQVAFELTKTAFVLFHNNQTLRDAEGSR